MKKTAFLALIATAVLGSNAFAQATLQDRIAEVRDIYAVDAWQLGAMRDGVTLGSVQLPGLRGAEMRPKGDLVMRTFTPADAPRDAAAALVVEVRVGASVEAAQDQLVLWLAGLSSTQPAKRDSEYGQSLGQAGFVGPAGSGPAAFSWVAFAEGNVAVRLLNVDPQTYTTLDLPKLAASLDAAITARAPLALGAALPMPEVAKLAAPTQVVAGAPVKLVVQVVDPVDGTPALAWNVGGEGQGYVERRDDGWYLFPTGPGAATVTLTAVGSTATVVQRTLDVAIADD